MRVLALVVRETGLPRKFVKQILAQKKISPNQLARITGKSASSIFNLSRPKERKSQVLTRVYPYPDQLNNLNSGPVFIVLDDNCLQFIKDCLTTKV